MGRRKIHTGFCLSTFSFSYKPDHRLCEISIWSNKTFSVLIFLDHIKALDLSQDSWDQVSLRLFNKITYYSSKLMWCYCVLCVLCAYTTGVNHFISFIHSNHFIQKIQPRHSNAGLSDTLRFLSASCPVTNNSWWRFLNRYSIYIYSRKHIMST